MAGAPEVTEVASSLSRKQFVNIRQLKQSVKLCFLRFTLPPLLLWYHDDVSTFLLKLFELLLQLRFLTVASIKSLFIHIFIPIFHCTIEGETLDAQSCVSVMAADSAGRPGAIWAGEEQQKDLSLIETTCFYSSLF